MKSKKTLCLLALCTALPTFAGCSNTVLDPDVMASGYGSASKIESKSITDLPSGYGFTKYTEEKKKTDEATAVQKLELQADKLRQLGWSQAALDLALILDEKIGLQTDQLSLSVQSERPEMAAALSYHLRTHLRDLDFHVLEENKGIYHVDMTVFAIDPDMPLIQGVKEKKSRDYEMTLSNERTQSLQTDEKQPTDTQTHTQQFSKEKYYTDIQVDTLINRQGEVLFKTRSAHSLIKPTSAEISSRME